MTVLHIVRHGQSTWNETGRLQGQAPGIELSDLGRQQSADAAEKLVGERIRAIYASDLLRAEQTAAIIADRLDLPVQPTRGLRERDYGTLEGLESSAAIVRAGSVDWTDPDVRPGGGESLRDLHRRVGSALEQVRNAHPDDAVALVTHGGAIRVLLALVDGLAADEIPWQDVANGSITVREVPGRQPPPRRVEARA